MCIDMCVGIRIDMCVDICVDMSIDMCIDMNADLCSGISDGGSFSLEFTHEACAAYVKEASNLRVPHARQIDVMCPRQWNLTPAGTVDTTVPVRSLQRRKYTAAR